MTKQEATKQAIQRIKGQEFPLGTTVAIESYELTMKLLRYESDQAICHDSKQELSFPRSEIFSLGKSLTLPTTF